MHVPSSGPKVRERQKRIEYLRKILAEIERIPPHRREDECADVKEASIRKAVEELEQGISPTDPPDELAVLLSPRREKEHH